MIQDKPNTILVWALLAIVIGWRLQDFFHIGMATSDQLDYSTDLLTRGVWETTVEVARGQGRLYLLLAMPVWLLAATYPVSLIVQVVTLGLFTFVPFLFA